MITAWLANKTFQMVSAVLALLAVIAIPAAVIQTVRLDGISLFGWHLAEGALAARDAAVKSLETCRTNDITLQGALDLQNNRIAALGQASAASQARAAQALAAVRTAGKVAAASEDRLLAAEPGGDLCKSADALILETVK